MNTVLRVIAQMIIFQYRLLSILSHVIKIRILLCKVLDGCSQSFFYLVPVYYIPPRRNVVGSAVLVL